VPTPGLHHARDAKTMIIGFQIDNIENVDALGWWWIRKLHSTYPNKETKWKNAEITEL
jgi:hypothetical protein